MTLEIKKLESVSGLACSEESTRKVVDCLLTVINGVIRNVPGLGSEVETSISFSIADIPNITALPKISEDDALLLHLFARSSSEEQNIELDYRVNSYARLIGARIGGREGQYPGWSPNLKSPALKQLVEVHKRLFNKVPTVYSVHAGLECGLIQGRYPNMDCVSIGPTIVDAHSPDERIRVSSVAPFYEWLKESIIQISKLKL